MAPRQAVGSLSDWEDTTNESQWEDTTNPIQVGTIPPLQKSPQLLRHEISQSQQAATEAEPWWLKPAASMTAAVTRGVGSLVPGVPLVSEPLAQLHEVAAGERERISPGMIAGETALSMIPGGALAKPIARGARAARIPQLAARAFPEIAERLAPTAARRAEQAIIGEAASALPAIAEGKLYTPGVGAVVAPLMGAGVEKVIPRLQTKAASVLAAGSKRAKSLTYGALAEGISPRTATAARIEREVNRGLEPVFDFAAGTSRKVNNMSDLQSAAKDMVRVSDADFYPAVDRVGDRTVSVHPIAKAVRSEITELLQKTNPAQAAKLEELAKSFDADMSIKEVSELSKNLNSVLGKFYAKTPLQQEAPALGIAVHSAMADATRTVLYSNLERMYSGSPLRQMMRERGAAEGISKFASESLGATRRQRMADVRVGGVITTPATMAAKAGEKILSPRKSLGQAAEYLQRADKRVQRAFKSYVPKESTIKNPIGPPTPGQTIPITVGPVPAKPGPSPISGGQTPIQVGPVPSPAIGGGERRAAPRNPGDDQVFGSMLKEMQSIIAAPTTSPAQVADTLEDMTKLLKQRPWLAREDPRLAIRRQAEQEAAQAAAEKGAGTRGAGFSQEDMNRFLEKTQAPTRRERFWAANYRKQSEKGGK